MEQWKSFRVFMKIVMALPMVLVEPERRNAWTFNPNCKTFFLKIPCHEQFSTSTLPRTTEVVRIENLYMHETWSWGNLGPTFESCNLWVLRFRFLEAVGLVVLSCYGSPLRSHLRLPILGALQKFLEMVGATLGTRNISTSPGTHFF